MVERIEWKKNTLPKTEDEDRLNFLKREEVEKARSFHRSFPQYEETPLVNLSYLAENIGVGSIYIKDESYRFGLNSFKVLGGSFAIAKYLAQRLGEDISKLSYEKLISKEVKEKLGDITFVTATDGNHGRGIAWTAEQLKQKSVVYMPKGSSKVRLENIIKEGAKASITDMNYDEAVRIAAKYASDNNGVIIQDTAWKGYEDIPMWIMQGYGTMGLEALEQLNKVGVERPTHIFIQAGVGSLAGAIQGFFQSIFNENCPITTIVEASEAACLYKSAVANDGDLRVVKGDMPTIMAGLACGEANIIGWEIIKNYSKVFISCPDYISANGMRILGNPLNNDKKVVSGESGAVTLGVLYEVMTNSKYRELKNYLHLNENSKVLLFSTEGDTDPEKYRQIVWKAII